MQEKRRVTFVGTTSYNSMCEVATRVAFNQGHIYRGEKTAKFDNRVGSIQES